MNFPAITKSGEVVGKAGAVGSWGADVAAPAQLSTEDAMAASIVRLEHENEELRAEVAMLKQGTLMLANERDEARRERDTEKAYRRKHFEMTVCLRERRDQWRECAEKLACVLNGQVPWPPSMDKDREDALAEFERLKEASK